MVESPLPRCVRSRSRSPAANELCTPGRNVAGRTGFAGLDVEALGNDSGLRDALGPVNASSASAVLVRFLVDITSMVRGRRASVVLTGAETSAFPMADAPSAFAERSALAG